MYRFEATLVAKSPITVLYPDMEGLPRTMHGEAMLHAGTFRGPLRKAALRATRRLIARNKNIPEDQVMSLRDAYMNGQGVDTTRQINNEASGRKDPVSKQALRDCNPFLSTFGRWGLPGRLAVGELRTDIENVIRIGQGARADMFDRDPGEIQYLSPQERDQLLSQMASAKETQHQIDALVAEQKELRATARKESAEKARKLRIKAKALGEKIKQIKDSREGSAEAIQRPLAGYEAIAPGSELSHRLTLLDDDGLGLTVTALCEMMQEPFIGGHRAQGCGEIAGCYEVKFWPKGELVPHHVGRISFGLGTGIHIEGDALLNAWESFKTDAAHIDLSVLTLEQARQHATM